MNHRKMNYFSDMGMIQFLKKHLEISEGVKRLSNPLLKHAIKNYLAQLAELSRIVRVPDETNLAECRWKIVNAYKNCRLGVKALVRYNNPAYKDVISPLVEAFDEPVWGGRVAEIKSIINNAIRVASTIPLGQLKKVAMDERVSTLLKEHRTYEKYCKDLEYNADCQKSDEYALSRRNCIIAYRCLIDLVENFEKHGDADSVKFMSWLKAM